MSIATELQNLNDNILDAYTAVQGKGGTVPANKNMVNLPTAIAAIPGGTGIPREVDADGYYRIPTQVTTFALPASATKLWSYALYYAFYDCDSLTSVDLSSLTAVGGVSAAGYAFYSCGSLASVDLSSLETVSGSHAFEYAFHNCTSLTSIDLSSLTTVPTTGDSAFRHAFSGCTSLTSVDLSSLATLKSTNAFQYAFQGCTSLTSLSFPALTTDSFGPNYTSQFNNMLYGITGCTVHFPAAIQSTIGSWSSVTSGFGGTNTTVLFDL